MHAFYVVCECKSQHARAVHGVGLKRRLDPGTDKTTTTSTKFAHIARTCRNYTIGIKPYIILCAPTTPLHIPLMDIRPSSRSMDFTCRH